ncbi:cytochrome P450 [Neoconidiobolus thromboides FSU 785]|nr:cytochrome P450 [Neoconidiobolus thromboides FSU 785]
MIQSQEKDGLNNKELMDNILGFFLAGHETTACVLGVTLFFLAKYPEIQEKLYQEVRFLLKKPDTIPTIEQTKQMTYLFAIMEESLRLYPPVSRLPDRVCKEELHFDNYIIPKGTRLALSIYSLHRDPEIWGEDSNEFKPERFLDENMNEKELKTKFITNGFGGGSRICLGLNFSRLEQKVVLSMLVNKFKIKFSEKNCNRDRIKLTPHPILYPKELYLDFELRE